MIKRIEKREITGYVAMNVPITVRGNIHIPASICQLLGVEYGDKITIIIPEKEQ